MADCMPCSIRIGGPIPKEIRGEFLKAIRDSGMGLDWGESNFEPMAIEDVLDAAEDQDNGGVLSLFDFDAPYGQNTELEKFLNEHKIAYDHHSDAKYEYDAIRTVFRPGGADTWFHSTQDDNLLVDYDSVREALQILKSGNAEEAIQLLEKIAPEIPDLEPLSFPR